MRVVEGDERCEERAAVTLSLMRVDATPVADMAIWQEAVRRPGKGYAIFGYILVYAINQDIML